MIQIVGGKFRSQKLEVPTGRNTRPTQSKLRETIFNTLQAEVLESKVLDLYSGSGALGFEAISRGADYVVFVENASSAIGAIKKNIDSLQVKEKCRLLAYPVERVWTKLEADSPFDLVFADPPYRFGKDMDFLREAPWSTLLTSDGKVLVEWSPESKTDCYLDENYGPLIKIREKKYGDTVLTTFQKRKNAQVGG